ncbi:MAG: hypothetical protein VX737_06145 [Pseudomonadota bacterium]|nr:hypothetical protein [Pseudomonadota bacterium]
MAKKIEGNQDKVIDNTDGKKLESNNSTEKSPVNTEKDISGKSVGEPVSNPVAESPISGSPIVKTPVVGTPVIGTPVIGTDEDTILDKEEIKTIMEEESVKPITFVELESIRDTNESMYNYWTWRDDRNQTEDSEYAKQQFNAAKEERKRKENVRKQLQKQGNYLQAKVIWVEEVMLESIMIAAMQPMANKKSIKKDRKVRCELYFGLKMGNDRDYGDENNLITLEEKVEDLEEKARIEANINLLNALGLTSEDFHVSEKHLDDHIEIFRKFSGALEAELENETDSEKRVMMIEKAGNKSFEEFKKRVEQKTATVAEKDPEYELKETLAHMKDTRQISAASAVEKETLKEVKQHNIERLEAHIKILEGQLKTTPISMTASREVIEDEINQARIVKEILEDGLNEQNEQEKMELEDRQQDISTESKEAIRERELKDPKEIEKKYKELYKEKIFDEQFKKDMQPFDKMSPQAHEELKKSVQNAVEERWEEEKDKFIAQQKGKVAVAQNGWDTGAKNQGNMESPRQRTLNEELKEAQKQTENAQAQVEKQQERSLQNDAVEQNKENQHKTPAPPNPATNNTG